jgi:hypothetical protein
MKGNLLEVRSFEKARNVISQKSKGLCAQAVTLTVAVPGNCNYCVLSDLFFFKKKLRMLFYNNNCNIKRVHIPVDYSCSYSTSDGRIAPICYCSQIRRPAPQQGGGEGGGVTVTVMGT